MPDAPNQHETNVRVMCPNLTCRKILAVPAACRGKTVRCRSCGTNIRIPAAGKPDAPALGDAKPTEAA